MKYIITLVLLFGIGLNHCFGQRYSKSWNDINYAGDTTVAHRMDIYLPDVQGASFPAIVIVYGSAFLSNNSKQSAFDILAAPLLNSGFAVIAVNHRSSKEAIFPAQIHDIKAAIRFIRGEGYQYQIDTSFIGITGYSSGGHLSSMAGTTGSVRDFEINAVMLNLEGELGSHLSQPSTVDAVVDWFGPTDFQIMDSCGSKMIHNAADSPESLLIGGPIQENYEMCAFANPATYVDSNDPPFLIFHGDKDPLVPHCQSEILFRELQNKSVPSRFLLVPEAKHGPGLFIDKYFDIMVDFFLVESGRK